MILIKLIIVAVFSNGTVLTEAVRQDYRSHEECQYAIQVLSPLAKFPNGTKVNYVCRSVNRRIA